MNTTENNKLIAEFMGIHEIMLDGYSNYEIDVIYEILGIKPHAHKGLIIHESDLQFHTSWEWLMPVVEKIEEIALEDTDLYKIHRFVVDMSYSQCSITDRKTEECVAEHNGDKKLSTYYAVVEFIKWYNENK